MNIIIYQLTDLAATTLRGALIHSPDVDGLFRLMTTTTIGSETKPVLVVGNAHAEFDDGHTIAVLNPDQSLADEIKAGVAYGSANLKAIVRGRCDAMVDVFVTSISMPNPSCTYRSRKPAPARSFVK